MTGPSAESKVGRRRSALALAAVVSVSAGGLASCGDVKLGAFSPDGGTPSKPAAASAWEPTPAEPPAAITAIFYGRRYALVGFTDGEVYWSPVGPTPSWSRLDKSDQPSVRSLPHQPVSAFLVDEDTSLQHVGVGYVGTPAPTIWVRPDGASDWYETGSPETMADVLAFSLSPFDPRHVLVVTTWGVDASINGGLTWGAEWPDMNFDGKVSAIAEGRSPTGSRRAWLGDVTGGVYFVDANSDSSWPAPLTWTRLTGVPFPARSVAAISVNPVDPGEVWFSFKYLTGDGSSLWRTSDYGQGWMTADHERLPNSSANAQNSGIGAVAIDGARRVQYTTAILSATPGYGTVVGLWSGDAGQSWFINVGVR